VEAHEASFFSAGRRNDEAAIVLDGLDSLKKQISTTLRSEMRRKKLRKKEFAQIIGVSFPTFKKLIDDPRSQSLVTIEKIFKALSGDSARAGSGQCPWLPGIHGGCRVRAQKTACNGFVTPGIVHWYGNDKKTERTNHAKGHKAFYI